MLVPRTRWLSHGQSPALHRVKRRSWLLLVPQLPVLAGIEEDGRELSVSRETAELPFLP